MRVPTLSAWAVEGNLSYAELVQLAEENQVVHITAKTLRDGTILNGPAKLHIYGCDVIFAIFDNGVWHALWPQEQQMRHQFRPKAAKVIPIRYRPPDTQGLVDQPDKKASGWP